jgi:hypothetical protein
MGHHKIFDEVLKLAKLRIKIALASVTLTPNSGREATIATRRIGRDPRT